MSLSVENYLEGAMPVASLPGGKSRYGLLHMAGNVCEWTESLYVDSDELFGTLVSYPRWRLVRGEWWSYPAERLTLAGQMYQAPATRRYLHFGFRCAKSVRE